MATEYLDAIPHNGINAPSPFVVGPKPLEELLSGYERVESKDGRSAYAVFNKEIIKSPNDDRLYRLIMLENGMEALLISDPKTDKAAAAMDVKVGHLSDPEDLQGLAHFCEHLMFMGTENYPRENEYTEFLSKNSGSSNAFTGMDQTCYYFDIHPTALSGALDRFAQFFISPLFDPSCTEREANAVHSENNKNLQSDMWRFYQLDKSTSSRDHVFWRFGTGDKRTLWDWPKEKGVDVRKRLIEWQEKYYSANIMKLCVVGKDSLDELTNQVVDLFSPALNRNLSPPKFTGNPLGASELGTTLLAKSIKDHRTLELTFPFPDENPLYESKPGSFLSHLIGHEGPGSILSYLKNKGWANSLSAGAGNGANGFEFFKLNLDLTKEGLEHREDVASVVFSYLDILKSTPPQEWVFKEVNTLTTIGFTFKEKSPPTSTAMGFSLSMSKPYPREKLITAQYFAESWRPDVIEKTLELLAPERCRILVGAKEELEGEKYDKKEEWYGTEYAVVPMAEKLVKRRKSLANEYPELHLPKPNSFIPKNLDILEKQEVDKPSKRPINLRNTPTARLWYKKDDRWWVPRASVFFLLRTPMVDDTALHSVQSRLYTELVRDALVEYSYDADLAGLSYSFDSQADSILLTVEGYNDKLPVLAEVVLEKMKGIKVDPKRFAIIHDQLKRAYTNYRLEQPYQHAAFRVLHLTQETLQTQEEKLAELDNVTVESLQEYINKLTSRLHIETLVHGNMLKDDAMNMSKLAERIFASEALTPAELRSHRALIPPPGKHVARFAVQNPDDVNSAIEQFTFVSDITDEMERAKLAVFGQMVQEPLFDQLRTVEQLGYIVSSGPRRSIAFQGLRVVVQSERSTAHIESRMDAFWDNYKKVIEDMPIEEFEKYKTTVINKMLEDYKNMWEESSRLWLYIHSGYYAFEQYDVDTKNIAKLTKADIAAFFEKHFFDSPEHRIRRLTSHLTSRRPDADAIEALLPELEKLNVPVDKTQFEQLKAQRPPVAAIKAFSEQFLKEHDKTDEEIAPYLKKLEALAEPPALPEDVKLIEDVEAFRRSAEPGNYSIPAKEYADLFPAKL